MTRHHSNATHEHAPFVPLVDPSPPASNDERSLASRIDDRSAKVTVAGLGYVGLPLACRFAEVGLQTIAYDIDARKVADLTRARSYLSHITDERIANARREGVFHPTSQEAMLELADAIIICVPTPLTDSRDPDLSAVEATAKTVAAHLQPGQLVVLESTTWPGTTRKVVVPILESSGLRAGEDFFVAYSPEREDPGNEQFSTANTPKVVAGIDSRSAELAAKLYEQVVTQVVRVDSLETAEAAKLFENIYRSVNIGLVNELKMVFERLGIDIWTVIEAAKTKPFGFQAFYPGPGLGGHCIPIDPFYLSWLARKHNTPTRFIELAGEINDEMPNFVLGKISEALNQFETALRGSKVCVLGVAYKKDVEDCRESPALRLIELLASRGVNVTYNDPHVPTFHLGKHGEGAAMKSRELTEEFLAEQDVVVVVTDHSTYDFSWIVRASNLVVDTRNATRNVTACRQKICHA